MKQRHIHLTILAVTIVVGAVIFVARVGLIYLVHTYL